MGDHRRTGFRLSIRAKLLIASLSLLTVPWLGYRYIHDLENYLRHDQERQLLERAELMAAVLSEQADLFRVPAGVRADSPQESHIYVRPLKAPIQLDGYADDWMPYPQRVLQLSRDRLMVGREDTPPQDLSVSYRLGTYGKYLYLLIEVKDDHVIYRRDENDALDHCDHLRIGLRDRDGNYRHYRVATIAPGRVHGLLMSNRSTDSKPVANELRIRGEWEPMPGGYSVELRIPFAMIGNRLAFAVADVDDPVKANIEAVMGTADTEQPDQLGTIVIPSPQMETLLKHMETPASRIWVVDRAHRVVALSGSLQQDETPRPYRSANNASTLSNIMAAVYRLILEQPAEEIRDERSSASRLADPVIAAALEGKAAARWRPTSDQRITILTAAHPVYSDKDVIGAAVVEVTSDSILIMQNRAIEVLVNLTVIAFILTAGVLLAFASRLSGRIRRLRNESEAAIGSDGRIQAAPKASRSGDEIGDLSRSFSQMVDRLAQYNRYLESMASKLAHELRTPVTVVRSSLDNLEMHPDGDDAATYLQRAREGVERLSGILTRMSEATRLEQTLQKEEIETFDLAELIDNCVSGYRLAHPQQAFELIRQEGLTLSVSGSPELMAQLLDKLIDNARDFAEQGTAIQIKIERKRDLACLSVLNEGPQLPDEMQESLFDSMVSMRTQKSNAPHLGLGLYIVSLITEFHHGMVSAKNRGDVEGVIFSVELPLS